MIIIQFGSAIDLTTLDTNQIIILNKPFKALKCIFYTDLVILVTN